MSGTTPGQVLREARRRDSLTKRQRVLDAVAELERRGEQVSFAAVARQARVSTWLAYADGIREHIQAAQQRQTAQPGLDQRAGLTPSQASLRTDLELARHEISELRAERDRLRDGMRRQLGRDLDTLAGADVAARVAELTHHNQQLAQQHRQTTADNETLRAQVTALEDDLTAARTSLRRMILNQNREPS